MPCFIHDYINEHPDLYDLPVYRCSQHSIHFQKNDRTIQAVITPGPINYQNDNGIWVPINTDLVNYSTYFKPTGVPLRYEDGLVKIEGSDHSQKPSRIVRMRPSNKSIRSIQNIPAGSGLVYGSMVTKSGSGWSWRSRFTEDGVEEILTLDKPITLPGGTIDSDYICIEEIVTGITFPDGWIDNNFNINGHIFHRPTAEDAKGNLFPASQYALNISGIQYIYTGVPISWLSSAQYPIKIDPDFASVAGCAHVSSTTSSTWATARATSGNFSITANSCGVSIAGYNFVIYRLFYKFDTTSISAGATVTAVNMKATLLADTSTTDFDVVIQKYNWSATDPISSGNREANYDGAIAASSDDNIWRSTSGIATNTPYTSGSLNTSWINKGGYTYYALVNSNDLSNSAPTTNMWIRFYLYNDATASYRPTLIVEYSSTSIKTVNGLANASVKTLDGLSMASVKTLEGLA